MAVRLIFRRGERDRLESLHPAYFALVMATGIVSMALHLHGFDGLGEPLFWLNTLFLSVLVVATIARIWFYPHAFVSDLRSHSRGVGFFTVVAATGMLGNQLLLQEHASFWAVGLWATTIILWFIITYGIFASLTVKWHKPSLEGGLNGGWLVSVVATQAVSILTVLMLSVGFATEYQEILMFLALVFWFGAGALYGWLMTLIFYRYTFKRLSPADMRPPYWINMGAVAISTLAGTTIWSEASLSPVVTELVPFIKGVTIAYWAIGSWWIPMLVVLGVWRYIIRKAPVSYDPLYWGGVFPLGMYSVCTHRLSELLPAPFLMPLSKLFMYVAVVAWAVVLVGMIISFISPAKRYVDLNQDSFS